MSESGQPEDPNSIPTGFRSGVITAITVLLGFSFLFLRSWAFELPGEWTISSAMSAILLLLAIVLELVTLWRSLQLKDNHVAEYNVTLRWFLLSAILLLVSLVMAALSYSEVLKF
jgi:hypothetical protein